MDGKDCWMKGDKKARSHFHQNIFLFWPLITLNSPSLDRLWREVLGARAEYECVLERAARPFSKVSSTINSPYSLYWPPFPSEIAPPYRDQSPDEDLWIAAWFDNPVPRLLRILLCQCGKYFILSMRENTINRGDVRATQESHKDSDFLYTTDKEVHSLAFIVRYQFLKKVS